MTPQEIEEEFHRLVLIMRNQGDLDALEELVPLTTKLHFINEWRKE